MNFTWISNDLYCMKKTIYKKSADESAAEEVQSKADLGMGMSESVLDEYKAACLSHDSSAPGFLAFKVDPGNGSVAVKSFGASKELLFSCMKEKKLL